MAVLKHQRSLRNRFTLNRGFCLFVVGVVVVMMLNVHFFFNSPTTNALDNTKLGTNHEVSEVDVIWKDLPTAGVETAPVAGLETVPPVDVSVRKQNLRTRPPTRLPTIESIPSPVHKKPALDVIPPKLNNLQSIVENYRKSFKIPDDQIQQALAGLRAAGARNPYGDFGLLQVLDKGFVEMTKHWICNVRTFGDVLGMTLFVTTDKEAKDLLLEFDRDLRVVLIPHERKKGQELAYGQVAYYELMKFRTELMLRLLVGGQPVMLVEADAYWARDVVKDIQKLNWNKDSYDMVSASDKIDANNLQGGFQINRPTQNSVLLWGELFGKMTTIITRLTEKHGSDSSAFVAEEGSEQLMMEGLIKGKGREIGFRLRYLPNYVVASGQWYQKNNNLKVKDPAVILNNWMVGNGNKVERAISKGHFFFNRETGECFDPDVKRRTTFRASITVLTMARIEPLKRLMKSLHEADYEPHQAGWTNDVRLTIKVDKPADAKMAKYENGYKQVVQFVKSFKSDKFSDITLEFNEKNSGLKYQWFDSFRNPRGWDEMGVVFEDDLEVSPYYFRYLQWHWLNHGFKDPLIGSISLQRQTLQATAGGSIPIVNNHRPFLYRLIGTWGLSMKPSTWLEFVTTYRNKDDVLIPGLITSEWQKLLHTTMWSQHFIHFLYQRNQFTQFINLPDGTTLCANWQEDGEHYSSGKPKKDFEVFYGPYNANVLEVFDVPMAKYDFSTKRIA